MKVVVVLAPRPARSGFGRLLETIDPVPLEPEMLTAAAALREAGCSVEVVDGRHQGRASRSVLEGLGHRSPDLVLLSADGADWPATQALVPRIHRVADLPVVLHGDYVRLFPKEALTEAPGAAAILTSSGDDGVVEVVNRFRLGQSLAGVAGVAFRDGEDILKTRKRKVNRPRPPTGPAWDLVPLDAAPALPGLRGPLQVHLASPGLAGGPPVRMQPTVAAALLEQAGHKFRGRPVLVLDEELIRDTGWLGALCGRLSSGGHAPDWACTITPSLATKSRLEQLRAAGCFRVELAAGLADELVLGPKGWTLAGLAAAVGAAHDAGLAVRLRYVVGLPGTSASSVASSVDFALKNGVELATFAMDRPAPGSPEWKKLRWTGEQYVAACLRPDRAVHRPTGYRSLVEVEESWRKAWTAFYGSTRFWGRAARKLLGGRARSRQPRRVWKRL